jgi:hypothetical protein
VKQLRPIVVALLSLFALSVAGCSGKRPSSAPAIKAVCKDGSLSDCPRDSRLLFQVNGLSGKFYLSAYLENVDSHEQSWLAPSADDDPLVVQVHPGEQVLTRTIPLSILSKGSFKVHALLTSEPVTRQQVLQGKLASSVETTSTLTVTRARGQQ